MEFVFIAILSLIILLLPLILSIIAVASCNSVKNRLQKLESAFSRLQVGYVEKQLPPSPPSAPLNNRTELFSGSAPLSSLKADKIETVDLPAAEKKCVPEAEISNSLVHQTPFESALSSEDKAQKPWRPSKSGPAESPKKVEQNVAPSGHNAANSLEQFFLGNLFSKLGALAFLVFIILFIKWISPYLALTTAMKVGAVYALSSVFMAVGAFSLSKPNLRGLAETLLGVGLAAAIMITYAGSVYFELWDNYISLLLASLILLGTYVLAYFVQRRSVVCLGLLAGYANLVFIQASIDSTVVFDVYVVILTIFCLIGVMRSRNWGALFSTHIVVSWIFILVRYLFRSELDFSTVALAAMWLVVLVYDLFRTEEGYTPRQLKFSVSLNHFIMILGSIIIYKNGEFLATSVLAAVILWALAKLHWDNKKILAVTFVNSSLLILALSTYGFEEPISRVVFLSALSLVSIAVAMYKTENSFLRDNLCFWNSCCNTMAFVVLLFADLGGRIDFFFTPDRNLWWRLGTLSSLISVSSWLLSYLLIKYSSWASEKEKLEKFSLWAAITLIYIYCGREISELLEHLFAKGLKGFTFSWFSTVTVCSIYALHIAVQAKALKSKSFVVGYNIALSMSVFALLIYALVGAPLNRLHDFMPIVNLGFLAHAMTILALAAVFIISKVSIYAVGAILVGWALVHFEGGNIVSICGIDSITSVLWMLYAAAVLFVGIGFKKSYVTKCGIFIVCVTLIRVVTYDIISLSMGYKLLLFFVLGCAFLIVSYYYSKRTFVSKEEKNVISPLIETDSASDFAMSQPIESGVKESWAAADTQLLEDKEVDSSITTSPFSDRWLQEDNSVGLCADEKNESKSAAEIIHVAEAKNELPKEGEACMPAACKASWHTD
ncbi:MAG: DUF2339 domain-containing protein [Candidatus Bruticola sp.]